MYKTPQTRSKYSHYTGEEIGPVMEDGSFYYNTTSSGSGTATGSNLGNNSSGSGLLNAIPGMLNTVGNVLSNIFSPSSQYTSTMYENMYDQEKRTTNLLIGVVVALVILAFVFIVIKNRKG